MNLRDSLQQVASLAGDGRWSEVLALAATASASLREGADSPALWYHLGQARTRLGDHAGGAEALARAWALVPPTSFREASVADLLARVGVSWAQALMGLGKPTDAAAVLRRVLALPGLSPARYVQIERQLGPC